MRKGELPENMPIIKFNEEGGENEEYKEFVEKFKTKKPQMIAILHQKFITS